MILTNLNLTWHKKIIAVYKIISLHGIKYMNYVYIRINNLKVVWQQCNNSIQYEIRDYTVSVAEVSAAAWGEHTRCCDVTPTRRHVHALTEWAAQRCLEYDGSTGVSKPWTGLSASRGAEFTAPWETEVTLQCLTLTQSQQEQNGTHCSFHYFVLFR